MKYIVIDGRLYLWRDILKLRREQAKQKCLPQPTLFELQHDVRPSAERTAADRYAPTGLFEGVGT